MLNRQFLAFILEGLGIRRIDGSRLDAGETGFIAKQLEFVMAQTYDVVYAPARARDFIPVDTSVPNGAEAFAYDQWDKIGIAKLISSFGDDLPKVEAFVKRFIKPCKSLGASYEYSLQDIRAVQFSRGRLNIERANAVRMSHEFAIDDLAAFGNSEVGLDGFTNHPAVTTIAPAFGNWASLAVSDSANFPTKAFADLNKWVNAIVQNSKTVFKPDTMIVDTGTFALGNRTIGQNFNETIWSAFLKTNPYIKQIDQWEKLDAASALGGPRGIAYMRSPMVCTLIISQEFEQLPPQPKNLALSVPTHSRIGGVSVKYPIAIAYFDFDVAA